MRTHRVETFILMTMRECNLHLGYIQGTQRNCNCFEDQAPQKFHQGTPVCFIRVTRMLSFICHRPIRCNICQWTYLHFNIAARTGHKLAIVIPVSTDKCSSIGAASHIVGARRTVEKVTVIKRIANHKASIPTFENLGLNASKCKKVAIRRALALARSILYQHQVLTSSGHMPPPPGPGFVLAWGGLFILIMPLLVLPPLPLLPLDLVG